jgi:hypothetical protein
MYRYCILCLFAASLLSSCMPPMEVMAKNSAMRNLACAKPIPESPVKVYIRGEVQWNGKNRPIANGYFSKRLRNTVSSLEGFSVVPEREADLKIHVKRNNKYDRREMNNAVKAVQSGAASMGVVENDYDQLFTITGPNRKWSGNVPHGIYFIVGDESQANIDGFDLNIGANHGMIKSLFLADEFMLTQVVTYALKQAQLAGCFR